MMKVQTITLSLFLFSMVLTSLAHETAYRDSLLHAISENPDDTSKVEIYNQLTSYYLNKDVTKSIKYNSIAQQLLKPGMDENYFAEVFYNSGNINKFIGLYNKAAPKYIQALKIWEKKNNEEKSTICRIALGELNRAMFNYRPALKILNEALEATEKTGTLKHEAKIYNRIAAIYYELEIYDSTIYFADKSLILSKELEDNALIYNNHNILASAYKDLGKLKIAKDHFDKAVYYNKKSGESNHLSNIYSNISHLYSLKKNHKKALEYSLLAYELAEESKSEAYISVAALRLSHIYEKAGNEGLALEYFKIYESSRFQLLTERIYYQIDELQTKYETEKKERENELLKLQNKAKESKLLQQRIIGAAIIFILILILIILIVYLRSNRKLQDNLKLLEEKNAENIKITSKLKSQKNELTKLNDTKDKFFSIIAHDLRSHLNSLIGFSELLYTDYDAYDKEDIKGISSSIHQVAVNMNLLLTNLLNWSRTQIKNIKVQPEQLSMLNQIKHNIALFENHIEKKEINLKFEVQASHTAFADENMISSVIRNLVSNAIKFTPSGGYITISTKVDGKKLICCIKDSGVGVTKERLAEITSNRSIQSQQGTDNEPGSGIGLKLSQEFIEMNNGTLTIENNNDKGTKVCFSLPR